MTLNLDAGRRRSQLQVSVHDGLLDADVHWQVLWDQLTTPDTVLLAHLEGHYSLVFAAREWTAGRLLEDVSGKYKFAILLLSNLHVSSDASKQLPLHPHSNSV